MQACEIWPNRYFDMQGKLIKRRIRLKNK
ncbi:hypothetical protein [Rouxiella sp. WC2420]|uniref:Uncharacterized protein n=1 Tax=Rouxiella sp. WC2420 TaxID=3234145 RepID=A0AB39VZM3_9GAMM